MLAVGWLVAAVVLAVLLTAWVTFTLTRLDRLHARVDAAQAALDAQLVRRAAAVMYAAETAGPGLPPAERVDVERLAQAALGAGRAQRPGLENELGRSLLQLIDGPLDLDPTAAGELREAAIRVQLARRFYNDAVRDTRALRARPMPRVLHLAGRRELPDFFDIDDTVPPEAGRAGSAARPAVPAAERPAVPAAVNAPAVPATVNAPAVPAGRARRPAREAG